MEEVIELPGQLEKKLAVYKRLSREGLSLEEIRYVIDSMPSYVVEETSL